MNKKVKDILKSIDVLGTIDSLLFEHTKEHPSKNMVMFVPDFFYPACCDAMMQEATGKEIRWVSQYGETIICRQPRVFCSDNFFSLISLEDVGHYNVRKYLKIKEKPNG